MSSAAARAGAPRPLARSAARSSTRPAARQATRPGRWAAAPPAEPAARRTPSLRLVPQVRRRIARAPFLGVVIAILAAGLLGLLGLNTLLAQDSFRMHALQSSSKQLADREQILRREVDALQAPGALSAQAAAQGMVPGGPPVFLRLPDGTVLGEPVPAAASPVPAPVVDVPPTRAVSPKTAAPKTAAPKTAAPKTAAPKTAAPKTAAPKPASPRATR